METLDVCGAKYGGRSQSWPRFQNLCVIFSFKSAQHLGHSHLINKPIAACYKKIIRALVEILGQRNVSKAEKNCSKGCLVIKFSRSVNSVVLGIVIVVLAACASNVKRDDIPNTANPQAEISKLETDINSAVQKNVDVLASSEFRDVRKWLGEAKSDMTKGEKQEEILNDIRKSRNFLDNAYSTAGNRDSKAPGLFESRQAAIKAGASSYTELQNEFETADSKVSSNADSLGSMSAEKLAEIQDLYVTLEKHAVIVQQLGVSQSTLNGARNDGAAKKASLTFKKTELSIKNAESAISTNVRNPSGYEKAVTEATADTTLLVDVMTTIKENKNLPESTALKMVAQNRQIKNLKTDLSTVTTAGAKAQTALINKNDKLSTELNGKNKDLNTANQQVEIQKAIEAARTQFAADEAEAYQQGGNLVIRMKNVNFASGSSDLPGSSTASLAKISNVAKALKATQIKIEGHTDSVGTETQNKSISQLRAQAVASYFKSNGFGNIDVQSEGYGFEKPIATNKTKSGRAQNRRVDVIITPAGTVKE